MGGWSVVVASDIALGQLVGAADPDRHGPDRMARVVGGGAELNTSAGTPVCAAARCSASARSRETVRIRSAVVPTRTTPAARAITHPVVPFWVTWTSMANGRPTFTPDSVSSWAVTGTMPLARAVTSALAVKLSWPWQRRHVDRLDGEPLPVVGGEDEPHLDRVGRTVGTGAQVVADGDGEHHTLLGHGADLGVAADLDPAQHDRVQGALLRPQELLPFFVPLAPGAAARPGHGGVPRSLGLVTIDQQVGVGAVALGEAPQAAQLTLR